MSPRSKSVVTAMCIVAPPAVFLIARAAEDKLNESTALWGLLALLASTLLAWAVVRSQRMRGWRPDPLRAAEVMLAYGRRREALRLLEEAVKDAPHREDLSRKLRELQSEQVP